MKTLDHFLSALVLGVALTSLPVRAEEPADSPSAHTQAWLEANARLDAARWELSNTTITPVATMRIAAPADVIGHLADTLKPETDKLLSQTESLVKDAKARRKKAHEIWQKAFQDRLTLESQPQPAAEQASLFDPLLLAWFGLAFLGSLLLTAWQFRVPLRSWRRGTRFTGATLLFAFLGCSTAASAQDSAENRIDSAEIKKLKEEASKLEARADAKRSEAIDSLVRRLPNAAEQPALANFARDEAQARANVREARYEDMLATRYRSETRAILEAMSKSSEAAAMATKAEQSGSFYRGIAKIVLCVLLSSLVFAPYLLGRRFAARHRESTGNICPRCADRRLEVRKVAVRDPRYPEPAYVECKGCDYRFRRSYLNTPQLCFPAVGVRASGKTHMLATMYERISKGTPLTDAALQQAPSLGDETFRQYVELVVYRKQQAGATIHTLPYPIILHGRDTDRLGRNPVLVNLFDYSGEMMDQEMDSDLIRRRALSMDGFLLFLDPTQMYGERHEGGEALRIEDQLEAMQRFYEDLRESRGYDVGDPIPVPVAICISKFDMVVSHNPIRRRAEPFIRKLRDELAKPGPVSLELLQKRSEVIEALLPMMLPGIEFRKIIGQYFGGQVLYFPVSSVGLREGELGVHDMSQRTFAPYGVVEPMLWLLHMHGYQFLQPRG